jgi:hypothetical protein
MTLFSVHDSRPRLGHVRSICDALVCIATVVSLLAVAGGSASAGPQLPEGMRPGDVFAMNQGGGTGSAGVLVRIDPSTGGRTTLSDLGDGGQGQIGSTNSLPSRRSVAGNASGDLFVVDGGARTADPTASQIGLVGFVFRVDPITGARSVISDFSDPSQGPSSTVFPWAVAIDERGDLLVTTTGSRPQLFRIDPSTGMRTVVSDFADFSQGTGNDFFALSMAVDGSGSILIVGASLNIVRQPYYLLLRVDPLTGARAVVTDFSNSVQGPTGTVAALAFDHSGQLLAPVLGPDISALVRVDAASGVRTAISDLLDPSGGRAISTVTDVDIEDTDTVLMIGNSPSIVFRIDLTTGVRTILSDPADLTQGVDLAVSTLAVVPTPVVNELISLSSSVTSFDQAPLPDAPAGTFGIASIFTNSSETEIVRPFVRVTELSGGNLLLNAEEGPAGVGARVIPDVGPDGILSPGESLSRSLQ